MGFYECISQITIKPIENYFENEAWWIYFWRNIEILSEEDYTDLKWWITP